MNAKLYGSIPQQRNRIYILAFKNEEASVNPSLTGAVRVPDASVDPFRLTTANALDASLHGARVLSYTEVTDLVIEGDRVVGVKLWNKTHSKEMLVRGRMVVNAAGIWGASIAAKAGVSIRMFPAKGSLLIFGHRVNHMTINRCRKPANADILVPGDVVSVIGTTSTRVPFEECDDIRVTSQEVDLLLTEGCKLAPRLEYTRVLRAYAGVRPLVSAGGDGRSVSRGIVVIDHEKTDGVPGLVTITGGKLTTARLMAEQVTDLVCSKLNISAECTTSEKPLPGSEKPDKAHRKAALKFGYDALAAAGRHGSETARMDFSGPGAEEVCECEQVTRAEIAYCVKEFGVRDLQDLRRHTRLGMGTCQGSHCIARAAEILAEELGAPEKAPEFVKSYLQERWKGMTPVMWGETLREAEFMRKKYAAL